MDINPLLVTPADIILLHHHGVAGVVTEFGGPTSHMSILARSLGIPGVVGVHHARRYVGEEELLIVDGDDGVLVGGADDLILEQYRARQDERNRYLAGLLTLKGETAAFLTDIKDLGCDWRESEDGHRLFLEEGKGPELIFRTARECGVQVRHLRPGSESLEDVFLRALGHEVQE